MKHISKNSIPEELYDIPVVIYGAGHMGNLIIGVWLSSVVHINYIIDDNENLQGTKIRNIKVISYNKLCEYCKERELTAVILATIYGKDVFKKTTSISNIVVYEMYDWYFDLLAKENKKVSYLNDFGLLEKIGTIKRYIKRPIKGLKKRWAYGRLIWELKTAQDIKQTNTITLLNTQIGSDNLGDDIVMYYTRRALEPLLKGYKVYEVATHLPPSDSDIEHMNSSKAVIACGTNFLKSNLGPSGSSNWVFDVKMIHMKNFILFAAGSGNFGEYSSYSCVIWNTLLHNGWLHSVRESDTEDELLHKWKVSNVINTGCVTLFGGKVDEMCKDIPTRKASKVILTVNGSRKDAKLDLFLFSLCEELYDEVYFWPQGDQDLDWISSIYDLAKVKVVERTLDAYNQVLMMDDLDYIGSRLHGGIHAMAHGKRSLIIAIDNRAVAFHKDTNIPIIYGSQVRSSLGERILTDWKTDIHLDYESIEQWFNFTKKKLDE